ncbi:hypothetical protein UPYG_G00320850 [Umbra pygmaea]|uniref:Uncharacterized protein n=1 Tax=Umbra pygmaea TaxID=75934 RepID=A0ABD0WFJ4_UMBPY
MQPGPMYFLTSRKCGLFGVCCEGMPQQLFGLEDGTVLVESYDWQHQLTPYFRPLPHIKQYQHFSFDAQQPGVVFAKERSDSVGHSFQLLHNTAILPPRDGLPGKAPSGLHTARQTYIF